MRIKVCGMTNPENIREVAALKPNYLGFIFYPKSPRCVIGKLTPESMNDIPSNIWRTGVFVNETEEKILEISEQYGLKAIQLHGDESPELCTALCFAGKSIIKAFCVDKDFDFAPLEAYLDVVDFFLFDTKTEAYGGSGKKFDWSVLERYPFKKPFFLSGGIGPDDAEEILAFQHPKCYGIDLNSKFETAPGMKDAQALKRFLGKLKKD